MIENCRHELIEDEYVQSEEVILNQIYSCQKANMYLEKILTKLTLR